jgi:hypothetical protein
MRIGSVREGRHTFVHEAAQHVLRTDICINEHLVVRVFRRQEMIVADDLPRIAAACRAFRAEPKESGE